VAIFISCPIWHEHPLANENEIFDHIASKLPIQFLESFSFENPISLGWLVLFTKSMNFDVL